MSNQDPQVEHYLQQVRAALADLPPSELDELTDELATHFTEVAAESDEPLAVRLGPAAEYAAELRASAGLATAAPPARGARLRHRAAAISAHLEQYPAWVRFRAFLPQLRPGWWVLRGVAAAYVLLQFTSVDSVLVFLLVAAAFSWLSVALGLSGGPVSAAPRILVRATNAGLAVAACVLLLNAVGTNDYYEPYPASYQPGPDLTNLHLYDGEGRRLSDVQVFDQYGNPVELPSSYDGPQWTDPSGTVRNVYPRPLSGYEEWQPPLRVPPVTRQPGLGPPPVEESATPGVATPSVTPSGVTPSGVAPSVSPSPTPSG